MGYLTYFIGFNTLCHDIHIALCQNISLTGLNKIENMRMKVELLKLLNSTVQMFIILYLKACDVDHG